jgi:polyisoprenoid-binding protein YceI
MKNISFLFCLLITSVATFSPTWSLDKGHSKIGFTVTHLLISEVDGNFKIFDAKITSAKDDLSDAVFELTAETNSLNTENERRDADLRSDHFFDVAKYPKLSFKSTSLKKVSGAKYTMAGNLTIKGITKPVTFDVTMNGPMSHPMTKKPTVGIKATTKINRKDFGVGASVPGAIVSEEVELRATGEFQKD